MAISYWENNNELAKCAAEICLSTHLFFVVVGRPLLSPLVDVMVVVYLV